MKQKSIIIMLAIVLVSGFLFSPVNAGICPIQADTDIVVYTETGLGGVWDVNVTWFETFLNWLKDQNPSLQYVLLSAANVTSDCDLSAFPDLKIYIQPGGDAYKMQKKLRQGGKDNIVNYLSNGGTYVGVCAGFYYAATDYYWQDSHYNWSYLLGLFPTVEGSVTEVADFDTPPGYAITGVTDEVDSQQLQMVYYGGPTRGYVYTPASHPGYRILTFNTPANGNSVFAGVIDGKKLLLTVHPEAVEDIYIQGLTQAQRIENYKWLANRINDAAGTSYYVPPYNASLAVCSDGVDNDGDGLVDYPDDPGCTSADDSDESDPGIGCSENFESGSLSGWDLSGPGTPWAISTENVFEGIYAAKAQATGAGSDSFMEMDISGCGTSLSYYRKLTGLDGVDDFEVSYYDNGVWTSVEHLGGNTADDSAFIQKSFSIPASATKLRFKCECGAVSEKCEIDSIIIE